ncbi:hypothetical protein BDY21DRAFT_100347 [Lineolata rhizophorae]|uniref:Uncharacterized protein n=1 Tax=Lineolata rhizophorae TaxID=578093 RepID=A0A6A6NSX3_9PEZI|nr:hypothetical protein BDY21DRAFT_100347 [Lineolata rhizophorae]
MTMDGRSRGGLEGRGTRCVRSRRPPAAPKRRRPLPNPPLAARSNPGQLCQGRVLRRHAGTPCPPIQTRRGPHAPSRTRSITFPILGRRSQTEPVRFLIAGSQHPVVVALPLSIPGRSWVMFRFRHRISASVKHVSVLPMARVLIRSLRADFLPFPSLP